MGLTNKVLLSIISVTVAFVAFSAFVAMNNENKITGMASTTSGTVNVTVSSTLEINFSNSALDFGSGAVHIGNDTCLLGTNVTTQEGCSRWTSKPVGLVLENTGNVYARVNLTNTNYSSSFFGGADAAKAGYAIIIKTPKGNATTCSTIGSPGSIVLSANNTLYNITQVLNSSNMLCASLNFSDLADTMQIDFLFAIPNTTSFGSQADIWTATAKAA